MQEDTYQDDGLNLYTYCKNNPVTYYDPSGYMTTASNTGGCPPLGSFGDDSGVITDPSRLLEMTRQPADHHIFPAFRGKSKPYAQCH